MDTEKNCPIAERRVPSNDTRNNCGKHFGSSSLLVSKVANFPSFWKRRLEQLTVDEILIKCKTIQMKVVGAFETVDEILLGKAT